MDPIPIWPSVFILLAFWTLSFLAFQQSLHCALFFYALFLINGQIEKDNTIFKFKFFFLVTHFEFYQNLAEIFSLKDLIFLAAFLVWCESMKEAYYSC